MVVTRTRAAATARVVGGALAVGRIVVAVPIGYLLTLTGAAWYASMARRGPPPTGSCLRIAVLVPAYNEELVIGETLVALGNVRYPEQQFRVHVVADHCTDATARVAADLGAQVHEHLGEERGKGAALQWAIAHVLDTEHPDVIAIVDADTIVAPEFLNGIAAAIEEGAAVVQGQYRVRDPGSSPTAGLRAAALACRHHLRPLGRTTLGASCGLYGNGMAFRKEVLLDRAWTSHLTEDLELQMELLLDGVLVRYAPDAIVESAMPPTLEAARTQNERWERGRIDLARRYVPRLLRAAVAPAAGGPPRRAALDGALDHLVPPLSVLMASTAGIAIAGSAVTLVERPGRHQLVGWGLVAGLGGHVLSALVLTGAPRSVYRSLVHAPTMVWWKLAMWMRMFRRTDDTSWVRTARTGEVAS